MFPGTTSILHLVYVIQIVELNKKKKLLTFLCPLCMAILTLNLYIILVLFDLLRIKCGRERKKL